MRRLSARRSLSAVFCGVLATRGASRAGGRGCGWFAYETLELELHREARDAHGGGVWILAFGVGAGRGEVDEGAVAREHVGDEPVVLVLRGVSWCVPRQINLAGVLVPAHLGDLCTTPVSGPF